MDPNYTTSRLTLTVFDQPFARNLALKIWPVFSTISELERDKLLQISNPESFRSSNQRYTLNIDLQLFYKRLGQYIKESA